jgi:transcriptional/translational regulatory protein YebC/TACO1
MSIFLLSRKFKLTGTRSDTGHTVTTAFHSFARETRRGVRMREPLIILRGMRNKATPSAAKVKADRLRNAISTKFVKLIRVAHRDGDETRLETFVKEAHKAGVSKAVTDRALDRMRNSAGLFEEMLYEGTLPGGICCIIEALTDKKSRTAQDLRHVLSEGGGALGASGVAMWAFERKAFLEYEELDAARRDALIEHAMDLEVDDVEVKDMKEEGAADGAESVRVWAAASKLTSLRAALSGYTLINEQRCFVPTSAVELDAEAREAHDQVVESLLALDDVEEVWTNVAVSTS